MGGVCAWCCGGEGCASQAAASHVRGAPLAPPPFPPCSILSAMGNSSGATKHLTEALRVDPDCAAAARALKTLRKAEVLRTAGNDAFKAK